MKNQKNLKTTAIVLAFGLVLTVFSSCNRGGQGCPNNFEIAPITISIPFVR